MYTLQTRKSDTLQSTMAAGASSCTLTNGAFGTPTGKQIITIDYDVAAKAADYEVTLAGTAVTEMVLKNGPDVQHEAGAKVAMCFVDEHYGDLGKIAAADAWTAYTPVWTATGTAPVIGNGTITGKSFKIGKYCTFSMRMTAGTTTTFGTGAWIFSLPYATTASQDQFSAMAYMVDSSGPASYPGMTAITDTTHFAVNFSRVTGVGNPIIHINVNVYDPFIWASGDYIAITGTYEAA